MARSPMLDVGGSNSRSKRCSTGLENHFGKNDPLWIFNPLSSGSSPKHYLKCLFEVFEVQFMYLCYLGSMFKWSLWILGNDCKHQRKQRNVWVQASSLPGNLWLIVVPSWVLKIEFDVISELVGFWYSAWCNVFPCLMGGMRNLTYSGYLSKSCRPRPAVWNFSNLESIKRQEKLYFHFFGSFSNKSDPQSFH